MRWLVLKRPVVSLAVGVGAAKDGSSSLGARGRVGGPGALCVRWPGLSGSVLRIPGGGGVRSGVGAERVPGWGILQVGLGRRNLLAISGGVFSLGPQPYVLGKDVAYD